MTRAKKRQFGQQNSGLIQFLCGRRAHKERKETIGWWHMEREHLDLSLFFTYTGSFCSLIMAETISLQPLPICTHKEIKTAAPSPGFSCCSEIGELSPPQNWWQSVPTGCMEMEIPSWPTTGICSDGGGPPLVTALFSRNLGGHDLNKPVSIKSICACAFA